MAALAVTAALTVNGAPRVRDGQGDSNLAGAESAPLSRGFSPYPRAVPRLPVEFEASRAAPHTFVARGRTHASVIDATGFSILPTLTGRSGLRATFVGSRGDAEVRGDDQAEGKTAYVTSQTRSNGFKDVPSYHRVEVLGAYPATDITHHDSGTRDAPTGDLEFDLLFHPGSDPSAPRVQIAGATSPRIDRGELLAVGEAGDLRIGRPQAHQVDESGTRLDVAVEWSESSAGEFGLAFGAFDRNRDLFVDPVVTFASYEGGTAADAGDAVAIDGAGNTYIAGTTLSGDLPTTAPFQGANAGQRDVFVTKVSSDGRSRIFTTYLGGSGNDSAAALAISSAGEVVVAGSTNSSNFPVLAAPQTSLGGGTDGFVTKINKFGSGIDWSTFVGGTGDDSVNGATVDATGTISVAGSTTSPDLPTTLGAFQTTFGGATDGFVASYPSAGSSLAFSTFLGGGLTDTIRSVTVATDGNLVTSGSTESTDFPTASPLQASLGGGRDSFVTSLAPSGAALTFSTYLGGSADDDGAGVALDLTGSIFAAGSTRSTDFPTANALHPSQGGPSGTSDAFLAKVPPSGSALTFSTYLGGSGDETGTAIAVSALGEPMLAGSTASDDLPTVSPFQVSRAGGDDLVVVALANSGGSLTFSTYIGGSANDRASSIAADPGYSVFVVTGKSSSSDFPTVNAFQGSTSGGEEAVIAGGASLVPISGTATNGTHGAVSAFRAGSGNSVAYLPLTTDSYTVMVPTNNKNCPNNGYSLLFTAPVGFQSMWYLDKGNFTESTCISAPASGINQVLPPAADISGYVKDATTAADIDGAVVYVFRASDGVYLNAGVTGGGLGPGRYSIPMVTGTPYKLLVQPPVGYEQQWYSGATAFGDASSVASPATANFSVEPTGVVSGIAREQSNNRAVDDARLYAFSATTGAFVAQAKTGVSAPGRYTLKLAPTTTYKIKIEAPDRLENLWWDGAAGFSEASAVAVPATANFTLREARVIWGRATYGGSGMVDVYVSAYTSCGCTTPANVVTDASGNYEIKVATTSASGWQYKMRFIPPFGQTRWFSDSTNFTEASLVNAPSSNVNQVIPP